MKKITFIGTGYVGLVSGAAISDFGDKYFQNQKKIHQYIEETSCKKIIPRKCFHLDNDDLLRRKIIETIMCHGEISINFFENFYNIDFKGYFSNAWQKLQVFEEEGLVELNDNKIKLTKLGMLFMRNVVMPFDRHLDELNSQKFSKTV